MMILVPLSLRICTGFSGMIVLDGPIRANNFRVPELAERLLANRVSGH